MSEHVTSLAVARMVSAAALQVDAVTDLDGGAVGEFATYGSGTRCEGVRVRGRDPLEVEVRLAVRYGVRIPDVAEAVRRAVTDDARRVLDVGDDVVVHVRVTGLEPRADVAGASEVAS